MDMTLNAKLASAIVYLVRKLPGELTRKKLSLLLYLADRQAARTTGASITGITYRAYYFGPYSEAITRTIDELTGFDILEVSSGTLIDERFTRRFCPGDTPRLDSLDLTASDREVLDRIAQEYGSLPLSELLDVVYESPEFKRTTLGQPINLSLATVRTS